MYRLIKDNEHMPLGYVIESLEFNIIFKVDDICWNHDIPALTAGVEEPSWKTTVPTYTRYINDIAADNETIILETHHHPSTWRQHFPELFI